MWSLDILLDVLAWGSGMRSWWAHIALLLNCAKTSSSCCSSDTVLFQNYNCLYLVHWLPTPHTLWVFCRCNFFLCLLTLPIPKASLHTEGEKTNAWWGRGKFDCACVCAILQQLVCHNCLNVSAYFSPESPVRCGDAQEAACCKSFVWWVTAFLEPSCPLPPPAVNSG